MIMYKKIIRDQINMCFMLSILYNSIGAKVYYEIKLTLSPVTGIFQVYNGQCKFHYFENYNR